MKNRPAWITACVLSATALLFHILFLTDHYLGGVGLTDKNDQFNQQLWRMHFSAQWPIIQFFLLIIIAYAFFAWIVYYCVLCIWRMGVNTTGPITLTLRCWIVIYLAILTLNSYLFPHSKFAFPCFSPYGSWPNLTLAAYCIALAIGVCALLGFFYVLAYRLICHKILLYIVLLLLSGATGYRLVAFYQVPASERLRAHYHNAKPNVIVIYYCSFKANFLTLYPNFKSFADHSVWFRNVISPTARSGPSLFALLTGLYPTNSHFFDNMNWMDSRIPYHRSITYKLQNAGYQTMFISNSSTYRRIDHKLNWGFQSIYTPPGDVWTLVMSKINDFPLTNLLFQIALEKYLFPANDNNADDATHYMASHFLEQVNDVLNHHLERKPLFLILNDESMHFPYAMAQMPPLTSEKKYNLLMDLADKQFQGYLVALKKHHLLDNAIVILTADHGEAQNTDPQVRRVVREIQKNSAENQALLRAKLQADFIVGHGSNAMDREQYHVPLIFHFYGNHHNIVIPQTNRVLLSTVDIEPTLMQLLQLPDGDTDGESLVPIMQGGNNKPKVVYVNTSLFLPLPGDWKEAKALAYMIKTGCTVSPRDGVLAYQLDFLSRMKKIMAVGAYWNNTRMIYWPKMENTITHQVTPALFGIMNNRTLHTVLLTQPEMKTFLKNPNAKTLKALDMTAVDVQLLYTHLMDYRNKVLASANGHPQPRVLSSSAVVLTL